MARKKNQESCDLNMTPMIDVVFQLIIFFIVTINMSESRNEDIKLQLGQNGPEIKTDETSLALIIEVDRKGRVSISNIPLSYQKLGQIINRRVKRFKTFPCMIRADVRTEHKHVKRVMDVCTANGIARVSFVAIKDPRTPETRKRFPNL